MYEDLVTLSEIQQRLKFKSLKYVQNHWRNILPGIEPIKIRANSRILFRWGDIVKRLNLPK